MIRKQKKEERIFSMHPKIKLFLSKYNKLQGYYNNQWEQPNNKGRCFQNILMIQLAMSMSWWKTMITNNQLNFNEFLISQQ